jgi:hypothetical protein
MKKIYAIISTLFLTGIVAYGQVEIREYTGGQAVGNDISGTTVLVNVTADGLVAKTFNVKNTSGVSKTLDIQRLRVAEIAGWTDGLCWGPNPDPNFEGQCYGSGQMPTNPWTTPQSITTPIDEDGNLVLDIHTEGPGCGHYRYFVMEGSTKVDSVDIEVCSSVGIQENEIEIGMTAYPNPANALLTINTSGVSGNYDLRITDVLGKVVYTDQVGETKKVDVSDFKNGVYLVTVLEKGRLIQTRRIVIKH